jgi:5'-3' exonuclease
MGIKNLKKFLRVNFPHVIKNTHISEFSHEKIAVDISSYIYRYKAVAGDDWLNFFPGLLCSMKKFSIHGDFIFDGKAPLEKSREQEKRRQAKLTLENTVMNLSIDLDMFKETLKPSQLLISTMEKINKNNSNTSKVNRLLHGNKGQFDNINGTIHIDIAAVEEFVTKKEKQIVNISKDDIADLKNLLTLFGVPFIQAPGEAEALAAYLSNIKDITAILTEDTDVLAYGTSIFISDYNTSSGECQVIYLKDVLEALDYSFAEFQDFCIMCGTDYNYNIPNYACMKVFKVITQYRSIEKFIEAEDKKNKPLDYKILNHKRSRELFQTFGELKNGGQFKTEYWKTLNEFDNLYDFLRLKQCRYSTTNIEDLWMTAKITFVDEEGNELDYNKEKNMMCIVIPTKDEIKAPMDE